MASKNVNKKVNPNPINADSGGICPKIINTKKDTVIGNVNKKTRSIDRYNGSFDLFLFSFFVLFFMQFSERLSYRFTYPVEKSMIV